MPRLRLLLPALALAAACSKDSSGPVTTRLEGVLTVASGLSAADYEITGPVSDDAAKPGSGGAWSAEVPVARAGIVFATPRAGTASAGKLAAATGLYMTPALGKWRVTAAHAVASEGAAALDARTTIAALLLMHPMLAHPSADVQRRQAEWIFTRAAAGWTAFADAAARWDADLAAGADLEQDAALTAALTTALGDVAGEMPEYLPEQAAEGSLQQGLELSGSLAKGGNVASTLEITATDGNGVTVQPGVRLGTALDHYVTVYPADPSAFPDGSSSPNFLAPDAYRALPRGSTLTAASHVAARSYASYLDVVGNSMKWVTSLITSPVAPTSTATLAGPGVYEVRFFSGGLGVGCSQVQYDFVQAHYASEARAAFIHNVAAGFVEGLSLIPGAEAMLGDDAGSKIAQEAVQQLIQELEALMSSKGPGNLEASDVFGLAFNTAKAAGDKFMETSTEKAQKDGWKSLVRWVGWGGKKAVKVLMSVPGKVAKGGALANRAARLTAPESLTEVWYVAVEEGEMQTISGTRALDRSDANGAWRITANASWQVKGTAPKLVSEDTGVLERVEATVKKGTAVRYSVDYSDIAISPASKTSDGADGVYYVYTPTEARLVCDSYFSEGVTHSETCGATSAGFSAVLPSSSSGGTGMILADFNTTFDVYGTITTIRVSDGAVVSELTGQNFSASGAPVDVLQVSIEGI